MNEQTLKGHWDEVKGKIREKWGQLTDDEVSKTNGNLEQIMGLIQRKTGESKDKIESFLQNAGREASGMVERVKNTAQEYASSAAETSQEYADQAMDMARQGYRQTTRLVKQRPVESLAVCFGIGLISGVIVALTMRSR